MDQEPSHWETTICKYLSPYPPQFDLFVLSFCSSASRKLQWLHHLSVRYLSARRHFVASSVSSPHLGPRKVLCNAGKGIYDDAYKDDPCKILASIISIILHKLT